MEYKKKSLSNLDIKRDYEEIETRLASGWNVDDINTSKKKIYETNCIRPGWSNNDKWPDGTDVDDYSIVDWIKSGMGKSIGLKNDASMEARSRLYQKLFDSRN